MKLSFTKKLILEKIDNHDDYMKLHFNSYLKVDYIERSLVIKILNNNIVSSMYFSSNDFGTTHWNNGRGILDSHKWETDDDLDKISYLARRYPSLLQDGSIPEDYVFEKIIPDILDNLLDLELSLDIYKIIKNKTSDLQYNWNNIIENYKNLSEIFLNELVEKINQKLLPKNESEENSEITSISDEENTTIFDDTLDARARIEKARLLAKIIKRL